MITVLKRVLLFSPPVALAILLVAYWNTQPTAQTPASAEIGVPVRVHVLAHTEIQASASGFGRVMTTRTWSGVAEVEGRLTRYADTLQPGAMVAAGALLFEIDPRDYEIAVSQAEADVLRAQADLSELEVNAANTEAALAVEREILEIYARDQARVRELLERGSVPSTQLDTANRTLLTQQSAVTSLEASLALVAPDRLSAEAALAKAEADLESAQRDLDRTQVRAPFAGRVTERGASASEYVRAGDTLVILEDVRASEVEAAFQPTDLATLIGDIDPEQIMALAGADAAEINIADVFGAALTADVSAQLNGSTARTWPARITRITGRVEEDTGAIGIVVQVDNAARPDPASGRPPLVNGSFVEVRLIAPPNGARLLIPERAVQYQASETFVYLADAEDRLARADISLGAPFGNQVEVTSGLEAGSRVLLSRPMPASVGLLLTPLIDAPAQ